MNQNALKQAVATAAIDYFLQTVTPSDILGVGTGSTANYFIDGLGPHKDRFSGAVASSEASAERLRKLGITVFDLNDVEELSLYVDGADEANPNLQLIKGGGAALTREKIVASCAREFVCVADQSKWVETLGKFPLPVEVIPMARAKVAREMTALGGKPQLREGVTTDNGNLLLDVYGFNIDDPLAMETAINQIPGVVANGIFAYQPATLLLLGTEDGVRTITPR